MPSLDIIVCTHERLALLQRMLGSLAKCRPPGRTDISVRVIANACTDATPAWLAETGTVGPYPLRWTEEPHRGKSHALNRALEETKNEWLVFIDDDHRLPKDFLENIVAAIKRHPGVDLLCGRVLPDWSGSEPAWVHAEGTYRIRPHPVPNFDLGAETRQLEPSDSIPGGGNLIVSRRAAKRIGYFSTELGPRGRSAGGSEDTDWVLRGLQIGLTLVYDPSIQQYHYVDPARLRLLYLLRKAYARSHSITRVRTSAKGLPLYLLRKLLTHVAWSIARSGDARRHHLVRLASTLGEIRGHLGGRRRATGVAERPEAP